MQALTAKSTYKRGKPSSAHQLNGENRKQKQTRYVFYNEIKEAAGRRPQETTDTYKEVEEAKQSVSKGITRVCYCIGMQAESTHAHTRTKSGGRDHNMRGQVLCVLVSVSSKMKILKLDRQRKQCMAECGQPSSK